MPTETISSVPNKLQSVRFSLAANYDPELIPKLAEYPVEEVYGKFPADGISGGRPSYVATPLSNDDLRRYIEMLDKHGMAFNYLLNGSCFANREWTRSWQKRVSTLLGKLGDLGVRRLTVSTPFLLELVKSRFPEFKVRVGIYAQVDTPRRARFWEDLGVYEAMGYTTFKLLERGIPSSELLRRVKAYAERRFDGNLAELLLSYGFKEPIRKESRWTLRHFFKPRQLNPLRMKPLFDLARLQGMLSPLAECPVSIDTQKIPKDFLDGFRNRDCASLDCQTCGYCGRIAEQAVSVAPEYSAEVLGKYAEINASMASGDLWNV